MCQQCPKGVGGRGVQAREIRGSRSVLHSISFLRGAVERAARNIDSYPRDLDFRSRGEASTSCGYRAARSTPIAHTKSASPLPSNSEPAAYNDQRLLLYFMAAIFFFFFEIRATAFAEFVNPAFFSHGHHFYFTRNHISHLHRCYLLTTLTITMLYNN